MDKRTFLKTSAALGLGSVFGSAAFAGQPGRFQPAEDYQVLKNEDGEYVLPPLDYPYDALEPYIDKETMELHHSKHHQGYVNGLNKATSMVTEAIAQNNFSLIKHWERELAFHGGGHLLHVIFWKNMGPRQGSRSSMLESYINKSFGSFDNFKKLYTAATNAVEGSGWGILGYQVGADKLVVLQAEKHHNLSQWLTLPILVCDVWEHAYYLRYQNKRGEYVNNFFNVINWDDVSSRLEMLVEKFK